MDNLDHLVLNQNQLKHLGAGFFRGLDRLTALYIDHNEIRTIHKDAFEGVESKLVFLPNNESTNSRYVIAKWRAASLMTFLVPKCVRARSLSNFWGMLEEDLV